MSALDGLAMRATRPYREEDVAAMMGHSNIQTTYRYYYALTAAQARRAQRRVARMVTGRTCEDMYRGIDLAPRRAALPLAA